MTGEPAEVEARARASNVDGDIKRVSTKEWAKSTGYDAVKLFTKVGHAHCLCLCKLKKNRTVK